MASKISDVDSYLAEGCGRCSFWKTPKCKVYTWQQELKLLREVLLSCDLIETIKWSQPCYAANGKNIVLLSAFKEYCALSFFKGSLLKGSKDVLISPGQHSQATRQLHFNNVSSIKQQRSLIINTVEEAIAIEDAGLKVTFKKEPEPFPDELEQQFIKNPDLKKAFSALTPGRQRGYILHFSSAKQSKTRTARIVKCLPKILDGKGMND